MPAIVLYDYWRSSASYRVRLALALKDLAYENIPVNLAAGEQLHFEHVARHPMGAVPVLDIDGLRLTQSLAIIEYLDETRGNLPLLPDDTYMRAKARALSLVVAADIHPLGNLSTLNWVAELGGERAKLDWVRHYIAKGLIAFERLLAAHETTTFCLGDAPMLPDICLIPQLYNARRWDIDLRNMPRCRHVEAAFTALPAFDAAHPESFSPNG